MQPELPVDIPSEGDHVGRAFSPPATRKSFSMSESSSCGDAPGLQHLLPVPLTQSVTPATGDDCGTCTACLDKPKFGGPGIKRKGCLAKRHASMVLRPQASSLLDSVLRPPVLGTPPLPMSEAAPVRRGASSLSQMTCASDLVSDPTTVSECQSVSQIPTASNTF